MATQDEKGVVLRLGSLCSTNGKPQLSIMLVQIFHCNNELYIRLHCMKLKALLFHLPSNIRLIYQTKFQPSRQTRLGNQTEYQFHDKVITTVLQAQMHFPLLPFTLVKNRKVLSGMLTRFLLFDRGLGCSSSYSSSRLFLLPFT